MVEKVYYSISKEEAKEQKEKEQLKQNTENTFRAQFQQYYQNQQGAAPPPGTVSQAWKKALDDIEKTYKNNYQKAQQNMNDLVQSAYNKVTQPAQSFIQLLQQQRDQVQPVEEEPNDYWSEDNNN